MLRREIVSYRLDEDIKSNEHLHCPAAVSVWETHCMNCILYMRTLLTGCDLILQYLVSPNSRLCGRKTRCVPLSAFAALSSTSILS